MKEVLTEEYAYECFLKNKIPKQSELKMLRDECKGIEKDSIKNLIIQARDSFKKVILNQTFSEGSKNLGQNQQEGTTGSSTSPQSGNASLISPEMREDLEKMKKFTIG